MTKEQAWNLAKHWIAAWNEHDLDSIMSHYDDAVELTSTVAAQLVAASEAKIIGKAN